MALLPVMQTKIQELLLMQNKWSSILNPVISNPSLQSRIIKKLDLVVGTNTINHLLGTTLIGWRIIRLRGPAVIYDNQDSNQKPELTLILISDAIVSIDLEVF